MSVNSEPIRKRLVATLQPTSQQTSLADTLIEAYDVIPTPCYFYTPILRENDETTLREAARTGDMDTVSKKLGSLGLCSTDGRTALMEAATSGHLEIARLCMLEAGAITVPIDKYNYPLILRNDLNVSWGSRLEETTDETHQNTSNFGNFSLYRNRRDLISTMNNYDNLITSVSSRTNTNENNTEASGSTDEIDINDSAVFRASESMDTPSQAHSDSSYIYEVRPMNDGINTPPQNDITYNLDDSMEDSYSNISPNSSGS